MCIRDSGEALQSGVAALVTSHGESAVHESVRDLRRLPGGEGILGRRADLSTGSPGFRDRVDRLVRDWQGEIFDMVRSEGGNRRTNARVARIWDVEVHGNPDRVRPVNDAAFNGEDGRLYYVRNFSPERQQIREFRVHTVEGARVVERIDAATRLRDQPSNRRLRYTSTRMPASRGSTRSTRGASGTSSAASSGSAACSSPSA